MILFAALASCGAGKGSTNQANGGSAMDRAVPASISLTGKAFGEGRPIPIQNTCDGSDQRPALRWSDPPAAARSFALIVDDPDAPGGTFGHWGVFDIPLAARSIGEGQGIGTEASNDFDKPGYGGPCPPKGGGPHHYHFKLFALDVASLGLNTDAHVRDVEREAEKHAVGRAELIGTYERR